MRYRKLSEVDKAAVKLAHLPFLPCLPLFIYQRPQNESVSVVRTSFLKPASPLAFTACSSGHVASQVFERRSHENTVNTEFCQGPTETTVLCVQGKIELCQG